MARHKWHDEIVAWASGAEIEARTKIDPHTLTDWIPRPNPSWELGGNIEYRIKPQPKEPQYLYVWLDKDRSEVQLEVDKPSGVLEDSLYKYIGKFKLEVDD